MLQDASCGWRARLSRPHWCVSRSLFVSLYVTDTYRSDPASRVYCRGLGREQLDLKQLMESSQAVAPARFKMHRVPSDVLKLITQLLDVKELGAARERRACWRRQQCGFEARARERGPGLVLHAKGTSSEPDWRKLCRKAKSFNRRTAASARAAARDGLSIRKDKASQPKVHVYSRSFRRRSL